MNATTWATVVLAAIAVGSVIFATFRFFYKRGADESIMAKALDDNTASTRELTSELRDFKEQTVERLHGLDKRVTVLETATVRAAASVLSQEGA